MRLFHYLLAVPLAVSLTVASHAQGTANYPAKVVRLVVPFAPGGATDIIGRAVAHELSKSLGQNIIVQNLGGGGGIVGAGNVARTTPDGYTLLLSSLSTLGLSAPELSYDPIKDFVPVSPVAYVSNVLVVHPSMQVHSVKDLISLARAKPGEITYGTGGAGTSVDLASELFNKLANVNLQRIAYRGSGPALLDLVAGRVNVMFDNVPSAMPHVKDQKLRAVAVTTADRQAAYPDLPTIAESGVPGYELVAWFGVSAPKGTPPEIIAKLNAAIVGLGRSEEFKSRLAAQGAEFKSSSSEEFAAFIAKELDKYSKLVKSGKTN